MAEATLLDQLKEQLDGIKSAFDEKLTAHEEAVNKRFDERDNEELEKQRKELDELKKQFEETYQKTRISLPGTETEEHAKEKFYYSRVALAQSTGDWSDAEYERKVLQETREKAQSLGVDSAGGWLVPEEQSEEVIELLRAQSVVMEMGATRIDGLTRSPLIFPRMTGDVTASWTAEAATITASDVAVEQIKLSPRELTSLNTHSNTLLITSNDKIEQMVRESMASQLALGLDEGALEGDGDSAPRGIANQTGVLTNTLADTTPTYDEWQGFPAQLRNNNSLRGQLGWVMSPQHLNAILTITDESNQPLERRILSASALDRLLGWPFMTTTQLPTTVGDPDGVIFGNWSDLLVAFWGPGVEIMASPHSAFTSNSTQIRGIVRADVAVRHPESFCIST